MRAGEGRFSLTPLGFSVSESVGPSPHKKREKNGYSNIIDIHQFIVGV